MKETRKHLLKEIKEQLKLNGASAGEICTELLRLEKMSMDGLSCYLMQLKEDLKMKEKFFESLYFDVKITITDDNGDEIAFENLSKEDRKNILYRLYDNELQGEIVSEIQ